MLFHPQVACRAGVVGVAASLVALTTAVVTALVGADPRHWTGVQGFVPCGLHGVSLARCLQLLLTMWSLL